MPKSCAHTSNIPKGSLMSHVVRHALIRLDVTDVLGWRAGRLPWACGTCSDVPWAMDAPERLDIHQAQLAPLMAALLGVPAPTNGMFMLPVDLIDPEGEHGATPHEFQAKACILSSLTSPLPPAHSHVTGHASLASSVVSVPEHYSTYLT